MLKFFSLFSVVRGYNILVIILAQYLTSIYILAPNLPLGDVLFDVNYDNILNFHQKNKSLITIVASEKEYRLQYGVCNLTRSGKLIKILEIILIKDGFIIIKGLLSRFNLSIAISSIFVFVFLIFSAEFYDFYSLSQLERTFALLLKVVISMVIYFTICRLIRGNSLKEVFE